MNRTAAVVMVMALASACLALAQNIDSSGYYLQQGNTAIFAGRDREAVEFYQKALRIKPDLVGAVYNTACAYSKLGETEEALRWLERSVDLGNYMFDQDEDFDKIRSAPGYVVVKKRADSLLAEARRRPYPPVVIKPSPMESGRKYPLLIAMHGYGSNAEDFSRRLAWLPKRTGYIVCCPYGPEVMGTTSFSWGEGDAAEKRVLESLELMRRKYRIDGGCVVLAGFSQGGFYAYALGLKHSDIFRGAVPMAAAWFDTSLAAYMPAAARRGMRFFAMVGELERKEHLDANLEALRWLISGGVDANLAAYGGVGHAIPGDWEYEMERALRWIERPRKEGLK